MWYFGFYFNRRSRGWPLYSIDKYYLMLKHTHAVTPERKKQAFCNSPPTPRQKKRKKSFDYLLLYGWVWSKSFMDKIKCPTGLHTGPVQMLFFILSLKIVSSYLFAVSCPPWSFLDSVCTVIWRHLSLFIHFTNL